MSPTNAIMHAHTHIHWKLLFILIGKTENEFASIIYKILISYFGFNFRRFDLRRNNKCFTSFLRYESKKKKKSNNGSTRR